jgi:hypothetical protein
LKDVEEGKQDNPKMIIYIMGYLPTILYGSERCTELTKYKSRFTGTEMRYFSKPEETE